MVAVKTLPAASADTIAELRLEARAMAALSHPALASIYGVEVWRDTPALVVEYCPGGSLAARLERGRLDAPAAFELGRTLLQGLRYMHARGVAHRDIKPGNIGFTAEDEPKLLDFGISTAADGSAAQSGVPDGEETGSLVGTASYLPPESFLGRGTAVDRDLWGIAVVMFEAIAGEHPYAAHGAAAIQRALRLGPPDLRRWVPAADPAAVAFFQRALAVDPDGRYRSASEQLAALPLVAPPTPTS
jgi:serine/threonine-protein kinase